MNQLPPWLRLEQIVGQPEITPEQAAENRKYGKRQRRPRKAVPPIIPVGRTTWEMGVREGRFPSPRRIGRIRVWGAGEIAALADAIAKGQLR